MGEGANEAEQKLGQTLFDQYFSHASVKLIVKEGEEPEEFWAAFDGGRTEYSNTKDTGIALGFEPRLFQASNAQGYFHVDEIPNFAQDDLVNDDIMILDAYQTIYVWIGNGSNKFERNGAFKTANRYIESVKDERDKDSVQVVEIEAGKEVPGFTIHFTEWRLDKAQRWLDADPMKQFEKSGGAPQQKGQTLKKGGAAVSSAEEQKKEEEDRQKKYLDPASNKFDYEQLNGKFPAGVDPTRKEAYLSDEQFSQIFGMTPDKFNELKQWKKNDLKKTKNLF